MFAKFWKDGNMQVRWFFILASLPPGKSGEKLGGRCCFSAKKSGHVSCVEFDRKLCQADSSLGTYRFHEHCHWTYCTCWIFYIAVVCSTHVLRNILSRAFCAYFAHAVSSWGCKQFGEGKLGSGAGNREKEMPLFSTKSTASMRYSCQLVDS